MIEVKKRAFDYPINYSTGIFLFLSLIHEKNNMRHAKGEQRHVAPLSVDSIRLFQCHIPSRKILYNQQCVMNINVTICVHVGIFDIDIYSMP